MGWNPFSMWSSPSPPSPIRLSTETPDQAPKQLPTTPLASAPSSTTTTTEDPKASKAPTTIAPLATAPKSVDEQYREFKAILALGLIGACPLLMLLPPRRFNAITFLQGGMFGWGVNEQTSWRTGHDLIWHYNRWATGERKP